MKLNIYLYIIAILCLGGFLQAQDPGIEGTPFNTTTTADNQLLCQEQICFIIGVGSDSDELVFPSPAERPMSALLSTKGMLVGSIIVLENHPDYVTTGNYFDISADADGFTYKFDQNTTIPANGKTYYQVCGIRMDPTFFDDQFYPTVVYNLNGNPGGFYPTNEGTDQIAYDVNFINCVENTLVAVPDINQTYAGTPVHGNVLYNDYDPQGHSFTLTSITSGGVTTSVAPGAATTVAVSGIDADGNTVPNAGTITIDSNGEYTFSPNDGFVGTINVGYEITDEHGAVDTTNLSIIVFEENENSQYAPIAQNDYAVMQPGTPVTIDVLANDSDPDSPIDPSSVSLIPPTNIPGATGTDTNGDGNIDQVVVPGQGTWTVNPTTGEVTFTPEPGYTADPAPISYTITDDDGNISNPATITLVVDDTTTNSMSATDDSKVGIQGSTLQGNVLINDKDPDGSTGTPSITNVSYYDANGNVVELTNFGQDVTVYAWTGTTWEAAGTINMQADGTYTFVGLPDFIGTVNIPYTVCDNNYPDNACATATLYVSMVPRLCISLNLFVALEGPFNAATGTLNNTLYTNHLLPGQDKRLSPSFSVRLNAAQTPFGQPYSGAPWNYTEQLMNDYGDESRTDAPNEVKPYPANVVDWVLVTLRQGGTSPANNVWRCAAWLKTDSSIEFPEECGCVNLDANQSYRIVIEHRNHLPIMSPSPVAIGQGELTYDFRMNNSYNLLPVRVGQKRVSDTWMMYAGNGDQIMEATSPRLINSFDREQFQINQSLIGYKLADFDLNAFVNSFDHALWQLNQSLSTIVQ
ncbi:MAG: Ig-like domain-containing protein [Weeksellaceae bacterium]|nr:Ig-like domain-containing protein [Weeksellaceae bacterium]